MKSSTSNFTQIRLVGAALTHADKRTVGHSDGQADTKTDKHGEANKRISQLYEHA